MNINPFRYVMLRCIVKFCANINLQNNCTLAAFMKLRHIEFNHTRSFAKELDDADDLGRYRELFLFPRIHGKRVVYFCGNSLGLQPKGAKNYFLEELEDWSQWGVEGHFHSRRPWFSYHHFFTQSLSKIVGGKEKEVVAMNTLTVNLHLLMLSFYRPAGKRYKILMEKGAFPSDMYAVETQVKMHGFDPKKAIIEMEPKQGEHTICEEEIIKVIRKNKSSLACVMMGGVNYYTGQLLDMERITQEAQKAGAMVGFDLAHAVGNVPLYLHKWKVDFACWCSYKYLNSGPGGVGGAFIHEKHIRDSKTFRLAGWWGYDEKMRFKMQKGFKPMKDAGSWQMSNAPVMNMAAHRASLDIFDEVGIEKLREKSLILTSYAEYLLERIKTENKKIAFEIITPKETSKRGAQLSLLFSKNGKKVFKYLQESQIVVDWREPNVIRFAPVPLYNSFQDVYDLYYALKNF